MVRPEKHKPATCARTKKKKIHGAKQQTRIPRVVYDRLFRLRLRALFFWGRHLLRREHLFGFTRMSANIYCFLFKKKTKKQQQKNKSGRQLSPGSSVVRTFFSGDHATRKLINPTSRLRANKTTKRGWVNTTTFDAKK